MDQSKPGTGPSNRSIPSIIVAVYAIVSSLWIYFSDALLEATVKDPHTMARIAMVKGWVFILVTSLLLYVLIRRYVGSLRDVNETLTQHQEELRESERRFRELMERVHMIAVMMDTKGTITFCNDYLLQLSGWTRSELIGRNWFDIFVPQDIKEQVLGMFNRGIATGTIPYHYENMILTRNGGECLIVWDNTLLRSADGSVTGIASLGIDVTEHRNMEAQLRQSQKMESIGTLAGGVAHDFNNILTVIMSCGEMLRNRLHERERALLLVDQILGSAQRAANLTRGLLAFSRKQQIVPRPVGLNELITQMHEFLERIIGEDVELTIELYEEESTILADRGQIEQVVMNLVSNARDAMPNGGRLTISTGVSRLDGQLFEDGSVAEGRYALLKLADTGVGIAGKERERIFEPFYTTKEVGKGTGMGLSMAYGIVRQHKGWIAVDSKVGEGSCFMVYLPLVGEGNDSNIRSTGTLASGNETILLVEDDEQVLRAVKAVLEDNGYRVIPAGGGAEAMELFRKASAEIAMAVIDVVMPQMNGRQVYDALMEMNPGLPVLFTSGYTSDVLERSGLPEHGAFISKPLDSNEFLRKVRDLLDSRFRH